MLLSGELGTQDFYQQLMRTAYRLIFLSVLEERKLLHAHAPSHHQAEELYQKGFSLARLTSRAMRIGEESRYDDLWQAQRIVFAALGRDGGEPQLALPALGGLFDAQQCPHLDACRLPNSSFLTAIHFLRWAVTDNKRTLIDYANMGAEELGSVYESLLELTPCISAERQSFYFYGSAMDPTASASRQKGNSRKKTGSYYTPSCLVEQVLKTSLDPLLEECCKNPVFANQKILNLRVVDPACGSGHFLLAAARRIAERLAAARTQGQQGYTPQVYQQAMHEVVRNCIYGVDINPMAIELARMNLWLEGYQPGKALSFLDNHLRCGNSLLGLFSAAMLSHPIPKDAYTAAAGDDKEVCKQLSTANSKSAKERSTLPEFLWTGKPGQEEERHYPDDAPSQVKRQARDWEEARKKLQDSQQAVAADIWMGAFLAPKTQQEQVPTTKTLDHFLAGICPVEEPAIRTARQVCREAQVFHWFLEFPEIFSRGGFDCIIGNPPWERIKIQEKEWFAVSCPQIAECGKTAVRHTLISKLKEGTLPDMLADAQKALYTLYQQALHRAAATSSFVHVAGDEGGRFPLTGVGDVNMFALFAETAYNLREGKAGHVGIIVPTNITTDSSTSAFFNHIVEKKALQSIYDFENRDKLFPDVDSRQRFCVLSLAPSSTIDMACYMTHPRQLEDKERHACMQVEDFARINPNTGTCPLFRSKMDAELTVKIYRHVPILINEHTGENPWGIAFNSMLHMSNDSHLFHEEKLADALPLYEGKLIHHYDHRFNTYESTGASAREREVGLQEKQDAHYELTPRYWVTRKDAISKLPKCCKQIPQWLVGFRKITNATNERTFIVSFLPFAGVGDSMPLVFMDTSAELQCAFVANGSSLTLDFIVRQKLGGVNMNMFYVKQSPFLPPEAYNKEDLDYISSRVLELSYTSTSMKPLAEALGYKGAPFRWDEERRALLKAELDAYYAKLYGLTREELAYILDPATRYPENCVTVTFPGLRNKELKEHGEYRTQRLVLAAFDELTKRGR